jgi:arsenate reductase
MARGLERDLKAQRIRQKPGPGPQGRYHDAGSQLAVRRGHARDAATVEQQALGRATGLHDRASCPRCPQEARGGQIGIGVARPRLVADQGDIVQDQQGVALPCLGRRYPERLGTDVGLHGEVGTHLVGKIALRRQDQVAGIDETGVGLGIRQIALEIGEDLEAGKGQAGVRRYRVMRTDDGAGLGRAAAAGLAAFDDTDLEAAQLGQMKRRRGAHHPRREPISRHTDLTSGSPIPSMPVANLGDLRPYRSRRPATAVSGTRTHMTVTILHNPRCSKSRQTLQILKDKGIEPEVVEYLKTPPDAAELGRILDLLGLAPRDLMRRKERVYKDLGLDDPALDREELIAAMVQNPILIERPVVLAGGKAALGRPPENVLSIL